MAGPYLRGGHGRPVPAGVRYGVSVICFAGLGHPASIQEIARRAEAAGWDGLFTWDHVLTHWDPGMPVYDPWVLLAGAACVTERLLLGTNVTPVPRRRPDVLANQVATLDDLSGGRAVLGVGIGGDVEELRLLGEETDAVTRGDLLDAGLEVIRRRWSRRIWVGGDSGRARRRAARWHGWTTGLVTDERGTRGVSPEAFAAKLAPVLDARAGNDETFDVVVEGYSEANDGAMVAEYADAGATWWLDSINGYRADREALLTRIDAGPAR
jgi:alkanesulfonate monooxygenase SsuD/methylene tetrahydromethanopterin reductase-like flavin-dependent oxidoreductase (luciferase family)